MARDGSTPALVGIVVRHCSKKLWGLTASEHARRSLRLAGADVIAWPPPDGARCLIVRADWFVDSTLLSALAGMHDTVLVTSGVTGPIALAANVCGAQAEVATSVLREGAGNLDGLKTFVCSAGGDPLYLPTLRKRLHPVVMPLSSVCRKEAERAVFSSVYKGVTDLVTKYAWPVPALCLTRICAEARITPNMVTLVSFMLTVCAPLLFATGWFAAGLLAAWLMTLLDTVDGKLARCTKTSSFFGNIFDHGIDLISPPFWWWAWHMGCLETGVPYPAASLVLSFAIGGYVALRLQEGIFKWMFGMHIHVWRRFDSSFRLIVSRRNPNLIILTISAVLGEPGYGMVGVGLWTAISILVHFLQIAQAMAASRSGLLVSWMAR